MHLPVKGIVGSEIGNKPYLALFQTKALRAVSDIHPPEIWRPLLDAARPDYPSRPDPDPASAILHSVTCMTGGGFASYGIGLEARNYRETLKAMTEFLEPRAPGAECRCR